MKTTKLFYLLVWQNGRWRSLDSFAQHYESEVNELVKQWKRSGFKAKASLAGTLVTR